jgi:hypothetical protein
MSLAKTKQQLIYLLTQQDNAVIALSGKWGTGKTHLWNQIKGESDDDKVKRALYVSLFGLSSVDQIKRKLIETAIPGVEENGTIFDGLKNLAKAGLRAATEHYSALAALNDLNVLLMAPVLLRNKVIVIDDIERKHETLGIDEVLGFIDEYSKLFGVRFVLVLNDDRLSSEPAQAELWSIFREKVIDQEIRLLTSPLEAFSIALRHTPSTYSEALKQAIVTCGLTNIRVVRKIIKATNQILSGRELDRAILARIIPSIVLFSAIHFHGIEDGPSFRFVLDFSGWRRFEFDSEQEEQVTEQERQEYRWGTLIHELGISECDDFEEVLVEYLESGLFEAERIREIIDRYVSETEAMRVKEAARSFLERSYWDHRMSAAEQLAAANQFESTAALLDPYLVTQISEELCQWDGGEAIGRRIIDSWISSFITSGKQELEDDYPLHRRLHPDIQVVVDKAKKSTRAAVTVVDACIHIIEHSGWGSTQENAMRQASAADFEAAIRDMDIETLPRFMRRMIEMRLQKESYERHFGEATQRFVDACKNIASDEHSPRLGALIRDLFNRTSLASEICPPI